MGTPPVQLGERLADASTVYRAFSTKGFRERKKNKVRRKAFQRSISHTDGLSVGLTALDAVSGLELNFGYCSLSVAAVHALPFDLSVLRDLNDDGHALIVDLPCIDGTDTQRELAEAISGYLTRLARVESCDHFPAKTQDESPLPTIPRELDEPL